MTLDKLKPGESATVIEVGGDGALRLRLLDMGLIPRTKIHVNKIAPLGDPLEVTLRGYTLTIRLDDAALIKIGGVTRESEVHI